MPYHRRPLNERDGRFLKFCFEQYFVARPHMMAWLIQNYEVRTASDQKSALLRTLRHLTRQNWLQKSYPAKLDLEEVFSVTPSGCELLKTIGLIPIDATDGVLDNDKLRHDYLVTDVRLQWESFEEFENWVPERFLRNGDDDKIPDALMLCRSPLRPEPVRIGIEVEITLKSRARYERKFNDYNTGPYDLVFYFTADDSIDQAILEVCRIRQAPMIYVCPIVDFLRDGTKAKLRNFAHEFRIGERFG